MFLYLVLLLGGITYMGEIITQNECIAEKACIVRNIEQPVLRVRDNVPILGRAGRVSKTTPLSMIFKSPNSPPDRGKKTWRCMIGFKFPPKKTNNDSTAQTLIGISHLLMTLDATTFNPTPNTLDTKVRYIVASQMV